MLGPHTPNPPEFTSYKYILMSIGITSLYHEVIASLAKDKHWRRERMGICGK